MLDKYKLTGPGRGDARRTAHLMQFLRVSPQTEEGSAKKARCASHFILTQKGPEVYYDCVCYWRYAQALLDWSGICSNVAKQTFTRIPLFGGCFYTCSGGNTEAHPRDRRTSKIVCTVVGSF